MLIKYDRHKPDITHNLSQVCEFLKVNNLVSKPHEYLVYCI